LLEQRLEKYRELEELRRSKVLVYVTSDRRGMEAQMHPEVLDFLVRHLDAMRNPDRISLILHSRGGETGAGWSIANLIRAFCKDFEVIVPMRALSAATLLCLGANRIIMTRQAVLGPIDPSVNTPLNPQIAGSNARVPVSVESIKGFIALAKEEVGVRDSRDLAQVLSVLSSNIHPLVLGDVYRARAQIRMLARSLLRSQFTEKQADRKAEKIVKFLCSDSGSHDYTIDRREARDQLGLQIERPNDREYVLIEEIYRDLQAELELTTPFNPPTMVTAGQNQYVCRRALIESIGWGTDVFVSEGTLALRQQATPTGIVQQIEDRRMFEGWRTERWPRVQ